MCVRNRQRFYVSIDSIYSLDFKKLYLEYNCIICKLILIFVMTVNILYVKLILPGTNKIPFISKWKQNATLVS